MLSLPMIAMFLQDDAASLAHDVHSLMIAEWIIAAGVVLVILAVLGALIGVLIALRKVQKIAHTVQTKAMPLIAQGQDLAGKFQEIVTDLKPKIASISSDVTHISGVVKAKVDEAGATFSQVNSTVQDVNGKTKSQVARVNGMVNEALTTTEHVSRSIQHGIRVPIQKIAGLVAAAKAGMETLAERLPFLHHVTGPVGTRPPVQTRPVPQTGTAAPGGPPFVPSPSSRQQ